MLRYINEYRVNKKGAECYRCSNLAEANAKLAELREKRPNVSFSVQRRSCRLDRNGVREKDYLGRSLWSPWQDLPQV